MRGNRCQKVHSSSYQAFDSLGYPHLATLGIDVDWNDRYLLRVEGAYKPCFKVRQGEGGWGATGGEKQATGRKGE